MSSSRQPSAPGYVFVSYVRQDRYRAERLQAILEAAGITVWRDTSSLWPGTDWKWHIREAITDGSFAFVACFSKNSESRDKSYQNEELVLAAEQMRLRSPGRVWLFPVRFDDCHIPAFDLGAGRALSSLQCVDLFDDQWEQSGSRLVAAITRILITQQPGPSASHSDVGSVRDSHPRSPEQLTSLRAKSPLPPITDARERQLFLAKLRFLGKFKPHLLWHVGDQSYDKSSVDMFLRAMRELALADMAELQAFLATEPRVFSTNQGEGYFSASVSNFFSRIDRAMPEYNQEAHKRSLWPAHAGRVIRISSQRVEAAQSVFLSQIKPRFSEASRDNGYDKDQVNSFLADLRSVSLGDIVRLQAFLSTTPGTFPTAPDGGYYTASVDNFMSRLYKAMAEYVKAISAVI